MNKSAKSIIQFVVLFSIGILLVWLSLRQVAPQKDNIILAFKNANYFWIVVSMIVSILSHALRAYRWNYLLKPLDQRATFINSFCYVIVGYFANYGIPRMGEISRCSLATKYDQIPFEMALGTVITERIVDLLLFLVIFVLTLLLEFSNLIGLANELIFDKLQNKFMTISQSPAKMMLIVVVLSVIIGLFYFFRKKIALLLRGKFGSIIKGLGEGIGSIRKMDKPFMFILISLMIWVCYFYSLYLCFFALSGTSQLGQSEALTLLLFGTFGVMFSPGGLGAYPLILSGILVSTYHIDEVSAFALPWLSWTSQFILIVVLGLISLIILPIINRNKNVVS